MNNQVEMNQPAEIAEKKENLIDIRLILLFAGITLLGLGSGFGLSRLQVSGSEQATSADQQGAAGQASGKSVKVGQTYGNQSEQFTDEAIGVVQKNNEESEGTHKLIREGGESQTAYLTSSLVDLNRFVNRKVKVWGETFAAQKVGWLMDVGAVKVLE